jgi:hypothetical protein
MRTYPTILIVVLLLTMGCSVFGIRTAEELSYETVSTENDIEIRHYAPHIAATASTDGNHTSVQRGLFRALAGYIFGKNTSQEEIAMTAPVVMNPDNNAESETIEMTAPVTMTPSENNRWTMAFSMPSKYTMETLPKPLDEQVVLVEVPARTVAVVRYSGSFSDVESRAETLTALNRWLAQQPDYTAVGKPFFAGYDPPFTLPFFRRNEVLIEVVR